MSRAAHADRHGRRHSYGLRDASHIMTLALIGMLAASALSFVAYILWPRPLGPLTAADIPSLPITVAGVSFNIPPAALRVAVQRRPGTQERIDLAFLWPSLEPPDPNAKPTLADTPLVQDRLFITIAANTGAAAPSELIMTIYPRYLESESRSGPSRLTMVPFRQGTPYQGEDLFYDGATSTTFVVRCSRPTVTPGICLFDRRIGAADITIRFPRDWLSDWRVLLEKTGHLLARLRAH